MTPPDDDPRPAAALGRARLRRGPGRGRRDLGHLGRRDLRKDICGEDAEDCPVIPLPDDYAHYVSRGLGAIRSAVASSPIAAEVMLDTLANAAMPISDEQRRALLKDQAEKLAEQARLVLVGPDLDRFERHMAAFNKAFW